MRFFRVYMESPYAGISETEDFEMPDDATEEEVASEAREIFFNSFSYGFEELKERSVDNGKAKSNQGGWYCESSPTNECVYENPDTGKCDEDQCIYCGEPEERK